MPEMFRYCGQVFQVHKRAHKTCDYSTQYPYRTRWLANTVHLQTRCDGEAHDGCQAGCLLYWKSAWLKPLGKRRDSNDRKGTQAPSFPGIVPVRSQGCNETAIWDRIRVTDPVGGSLTYICQMTQVRQATSALAWWDVRQYLEDYTSGNVGIATLCKAFAYSVYYHLSQAGIGLGPAMRWFYDRVNPLRGGTLFPRKPGEIPEGSPTPSGLLNLRPGELVRVKPHLEILKTVDSSNRNRGMYWDAELVPYCGGAYRVLKSVTKIIDEKTSRMIEMKNPCIVLDSVICRARYSPCRMLCPKEMYPYWREIWLERVEGQAGDGPSAEKSMRLSVREDRQGQKTIPQLEIKR